MSKMPEIKLDLDHVANVETVSKEKTLAPQRFDLQSALLEIVKDKSIDPDRLEKFMDLHFRLEDRQAKAAFNVAMAAFQSECPVIQKSKHVDFSSKAGRKVKYDYAPYEEIVAVVGPILSKHGLSWSFNIKRAEQGGMDVLLTAIAHASGFEKVFEWEFYPIHSDEHMNDSQRRKSALSYAKRSGLENALGIATADEDDDALSAVELLSPDQEKEIHALISSTRTNVAELLKFLGAQKISALTNAEAKRAIHALKQKKELTCSR